MCRKMQNELRVGTFTAQQYEFRFYKFVFSFGSSKLLMITAS
jgi:hypothetical protein